MSNPEAHDGIPADPFEPLEDDGCGYYLLWCQPSPPGEKDRDAAARQMLAALTAITAMLRKEAPGTPLNNHRFDALGIQAYTAIAAAERAGIKAEG